MALLGQDVIDIGSTRLKQQYVLGAHVPLDNPNWQGPWDCAEFTSWCAYQAYGMIFGAGNVTKVAKAEPYSGYWYAEARKKALVISPAEALKIPGAVLIRAPAPGKIGHVAFALGDNDRTLEARGAAFGVGIFKGAAGRSWSIGCLLPGVDYANGLKPPVLEPPADKSPALPPGYFWLKTPNFKGAAIVALQRALKAKAIDPGPFDGEYGPMTNAAVISFQLVKGLEVDGVVGPNTAGALGLAFPVVPNAEDEQIYRDARTPKGPVSIKLPQGAAALDAIVDIAQSGKTFSAKTASGFGFIIAATTQFTDDMNRTGLYQDKTAIKDSLKFGAYKTADYSPAFGQWAHFIEPTLTAEGGGRFATLNTYDRAAFTFGAPQLAAHTPGENFIVYLQRLLGLADADKHFPELSLRKNAAGRTTVHRADGGGFEDLEQVIIVERPNGKKERQLARLMAYLNPSPTSIDAAELSTSARLMNWLRIDPKAKELQISVFIDHAKARFDLAKTKVDGFTGDDWRISLWIMDIMHQGRGSFGEMTAALASGDPEGRLKELGWPKYKTRIQTVEAAVGRLAASGVMNGFKV
ncbi:MAG: peptidoglycan-binding protein [Rhizobiales bacterium]|nr:peptidoglycan-binding protein [Hyphomicrobiales bacterium]